MKAALLRAIAPIETNPLQLVELPVPQPGDGQVWSRSALAVFAAQTCT